jgi:HAD superfamily hydrolase (TIGR01509 family)
MIKAIIFDLNGTVLADEDQYAQAFRDVLKKLGKIVDEKFPHVRGIGVQENWQGLLTKYHIKTTKTTEELASLTQESYLLNLPQVKLTKGFIQFVQTLKDNHILTALATSNTYSVTNQVLEKLGIGSWFDVITTSEDVGFNKPSPEIFSVTADKLGISPNDCLVIEDAAAGIEAAHAAEISVIAIARTDSRKQELSEADLIIKSFDDLDMSTLNKLATSFSKIIA